jgi:cold shock CspA family protein
LSTEPSRFHGVVAEFDEHKGWGSVRADDGRDLFFHCTEIGDGTRTIAVGTEVEFDVGPGRGGRWEAYRVIGAPSGR